MLFYDKVKNMKVLIYVNKEKDLDGVWLNKTIAMLKENNIEYLEITESDFSKKFTADALFVLGGDGTILQLSEFSHLNNIPIVGINAGKLGFLTEFERFETLEAIELLLQSKLKEDPRLNINVLVNGKNFTALNDVVVQRTFENSKGTVISVSVEIDGNKVDKVVGDGVIVCTPTGSTAYSLSAGGVILAPGISAFAFTPIAAHSLTQRPIIFSCDHMCKITLSAGERAGIVIDGKLVSILSCGDSIEITKSPKTTVFLRREKSNFFNTLTGKMMEGRCE